MSACASLLSIEETKDVSPIRRSEASGAGWQEHFVNIEQAAVSDSVGAAISESLSYVTIPNFGSLEELGSLKDSALQLFEENTNLGTPQPYILAASNEHGNVDCTRYSVETLLNQSARATHATFLARLLGFLENDKDMFKIFRNSSLSSKDHYTAKWYSEPNDQGVLIPEPKVNIYHKGGYFKEHTDGMQLTLLVVLNDGYEGGGTAFYAQEASEQVWGTDRGEEPDRVARPPAGTALIWGGNLWHMALPVTEGMRAVYVGSFDLEKTTGE
jgi:hypothetical protein